MADLQALNVQITADATRMVAGINDGRKSLNDFQNQLTRFRTALGTATDPAAIVRLNRAIEATERRMAALRNAGRGSFENIATSANTADASLVNFGRGANQATNATTNLGRVLQDAPFGFIGIANNLNPLLESFQRLGRETGGVRGALSALGSSLLGAGGIGLALSAFQFFALGGVDAVKKMFGALGDNKAVAEARKEIEAFNKSLKDAEAGALATGLKLQSFVDIAKNGALPLSQRNEALKEANKILGEHGTKLTLANVATEAITKQTEMFTKALIAQAVAAKYADRIADLSVKQADARNTLLKSTLALSKAEADLRKERESRVGSAAGFDSKVYGDLRNKQKENLQVLTSTTLQIKEITDNFKQATNEATKLGGKLDDGKDGLGKTGKSIESISDIVAKLRKELAALNVLNQKGFIDSFELDKKSVDEYQKAIQDIARKDKNAIEITNLSIEIQPTILAMAIAEYRDKIGKLGLETITLKSKIEIDPIIVPKGQPVKNAALAAFDKLREDTRLAAEKLNADIDGILANTATAAFANFGESLGQLITGKISVGDLFGGLFNILGQGIQQLGKSLIEYGVLAKLAKTSFASAFANPIGAIAAGIALTAFGGIVKSAGSLKLADGGFVSGKGGSRTDSIPAMLSNGEYVINAAAVRKFGLNNLDRINSLQGFAAGGVIGVPQPYAVPNNNVSIERGNEVVIMGETVLRGNDIFVLYNRAAKQAGRNS